MAVETNSETVEDFTKTWKSSSDEAKMEHRLKCQIFGDNELSRSTATILSNSPAVTYNKNSVNAVSMTWKLSGNQENKLEHWTEIHTSFEARVPNNRIFIHIFTKIILYYILI